MRSVSVWLSAAPQNVFKMILARGLALALVGVVIGLSASLVLARFLRSLLYGVRPTDPLTFLVVALILLCVAFLPSSFLRDGR